MVLEKQRSVDVLIGIAKTENGSRKVRNSLQIGTDCEVVKISPKRAAKETQKAAGKPTLMFLNGLLCMSMLLQTRFVQITDIGNPLKTVSQLMHMCSFFGHVFWCSLASTAKQTINAWSHTSVVGQNGWLSLAIPTSNIHVK